MKVVTILGTRPEIIRLSSIIKKLDLNTDHTLVHTGQNYDYELNEIFFDELLLKSPDYFLDVSHKSSSASAIGEIISKSDKLLKELKPDCVLILGDTNSCLSAISAKRNKIPIFHLEAGNRCFDQRVPEEINRKIVDHVSDINFTYSSISREYLIAEGFDPQRVIKVGSPMQEVLKANIDLIEQSNALKKNKLNPFKYFLFSLHREENIESDKFFDFVKLLNAIASKYKLPVIVSTHPRTKKRIKKEKIKFNKNIRLLKPLSFCDYNSLQINAKVTLSDSGTITEESSILNFPAINIRETNERPEGMEEGAVMMLDSNKERIFNAISILDNQGRGDTRSLIIVADYSCDNVSEKILRIIMSYTDFVNRKVWKQT